MKVVIFDFNRTIFDPEKKKLVWGAKKVLKTLKNQNFLLFLVSRGGRRRKKLIKESKIFSMFDKVFVVQNKKQIFQELSRKIDFSKVFVIGDRIKKEIFFGNILGAKTIWLRQGKFAKELPKRKDEKPKFIAKSLKEVLKIILEGRSL